MKKKFEVGAVFTSTALSDFTAFTSPSTPIRDITVRGLGGRFAYNVKDYVVDQVSGSDHRNWKLLCDVWGEKPKATSSSLSALAGGF